MTTMRRFAGLLTEAAMVMAPTYVFAVDWNFETGRLEGWTQSGGTAFANQPTKGNNVVARGRDARFSIQGTYFIGTFENRPNDGVAAGSTQGDGPIGVITSDLVTLTRNTFSCLLGGGQDFEHVYVAVLIKATPENRERFEVDPRDPDTNRSIPFPKVRLADGDYYEVLRETGRNEEAMRRVSMTMSYVRAGDQARVRIADLSYSAWGHINVDDIQLGAAPASLVSRIHVTDDGGSNLRGAEVFVDGVFRGTSDAAGMVSGGIVRTGDRIVARKRIREERTYRSGHGAGSTQNWKYRIYATSLPIANDGSATPVSAHGDSSRPEEVRVSRDNVLFGLNINVSVEWVASPAEVNQIRQDLNDAAAYMYNATDGQFTFEQIDFRTDARGWRDADFRVHADRDLRPHCDIPFGWWDPGLLPPGLIHLARTTMGWGGPPVYVHEFGHYGFGLFDEYLDLSPLVRCTGSGSGPFASNGANASCMMYIQSERPKICSGHPSNPHFTPTLQGILRGEDCWSSILRAYRSPRTDLVHVFNLKTPVTRGAIPGTLPPMPVGWRPRFIESVATHGGYRGPIVVTVSDGSTPREGVGVWLHTQEGRDIYQGATDAAGQIDVLGCHNYDVLRFDGRERQISPFGGLLASRNPAGGFQQKNRLEVKLAVDAPKLLLGTSLGEGGKVPSLAIRATNGKLDEAPTASVAFDPQSKPQVLKVVLDEQMNAYVAGLPGTTPTGAVVTVEAKVNGEKLIGNTTVKFLESNGEHLDLYSPDGAMVFKVPDGGIEKGVKVTAGWSAEEVPASEGRVLAGPYAITASGPYKAGKDPLVLSFRLNPRQKQANAKGFRILRSEGGKWVEVPGLVYGSEMGTLAVPADRLGTYVLTVR